MPCSQCTSSLRRATDLRAAGERDALVDHRPDRWPVVDGRQVQEDQRPQRLQSFRIVAILGAQVDDRADLVICGPGFRRAPSRSAADRQRRR
jgi:hypothetical protein